MSKRRDNIIFAIVAIIVLVALGIGAFLFLQSRGVINPDDDDYSVVFVLGPRVNSRTINFDDNHGFDERIERVVNSYGFAAIVVADGMPANQTDIFDFSAQRPRPFQRIFEASAIEANQTRFRFYLRETMRDARAEAEQADILEAISLAARMLNARPGDGEREIVILGTGLSTSGWLNFAADNTLLISDTTVVVDSLQRIGNLPELEGITVTWFQMHDVASPQRDLPNPLRMNLEAIWRMILMDSGAAAFNLDPELPGTGIYTLDFPPTGLPYVSVVEFELLPIVSQVTVHPGQVTMERGGNQTFSQLVSGFGGDVPQGVRWTVEGPSHPGTEIDETGTLVIAADDPRESIRVRAASDVDPNVFGEATIVIGSLEVIQVGVPERIIIIPGPDIFLETDPPNNVVTVRTIVEGSNNPSQAVNLELIGNTSPNTRIEPSGQITICPNETSFLIVLRVTSEVDPTIIGEANLFVRRPPDVVEVRFIGNSANFVSITQARAAVSEWVDFINEQDGGIYLFGCTANTGQGAGVQLGTERANAVRDLFVREFNIDPSRIRTRGLGHDNPWNVPNGIPGTGSWNETVAASNRIVVIMSAEDEWARRIYNGTWR